LETKEKDVDEEEKEEGGGWRGRRTRRGSK